MLQIHQVPVLSDNYVYLVHDPEDGMTAAVDPAESEPVAEALAARGWSLTHILLTHHHHDHVGGVAALKAASGCTVVGARADAGRLPGLDHPVADGDTVTLGRATAQVLAVPGHTRGHIAYWFDAESALFCGDTLFVLGCGRMFEGTPEEFWGSLSRLRDLPDSTRVYCAHEYTAANARFALSVEPDNPELVAWAGEIDDLRRRGLSTVPSLLGREKLANPFLRADRPALASAVGLAGAAPVEVFAEVRRRKDRF
ncbi:hydroxyacylglutathione hydrolase [Roseospirillum parvum]|uniref:Hydroxyacylglutathione hydrolase n=1 Tax=Roseospirillum parvum TaxID=83401 RepID=A0A1G7U597_9PROT|nr:hydroxyacylglutathione hydrolase [Roseospirillum parvum]SDG42617.1 hydroxyacylglutathione hydrolase [Roseospirillum parvum]